MVTLITAVVEEPKFIFQYENDLFDSTIQIYLECTYNNEKYAQEVERLAHIQEEFDERSQAIQYDTEKFISPAYVAAFSYNHCYEYALPLENNKIVYVFLQFADQEKIQFSEEYLPHSYEMYEENSGYSIYAFPMENGIVKTTY